ncbi:MAG: hypothetical protein LBR98_08290 [Syntrophomonadaceae bacterium]|nr:hypothetical protein [Syntrophomonadaceae bacterium]
MNKGTMILHEIDLIRGTVIIEGNGTGIDGITAEYNGETCNIIDYINDYLETIYIDAYEAAIEMYIHKLYNKNIPEHQDFQYIPPYLNKMAYKKVVYLDDYALYDKVIKDSIASFKDITENIFSFIEKLKKQRMP